MKKFNLYIADPRLHGEEKAKTELNYFPIKKEISCKEDLAEAVKYAHTPALFKPDESGLNKRRKENFVKSNVLIADIDNKKKKKNMKLIRTVREVFKDVEFLTVFSKSTDTSRGIYALHLYFPIGKDIEDVVEYEKYLRLLVKNYDFLDPAVKDAARLFFYTQEKYCDPEFIYYNKGNSIIEILDTIGEPIRDDYTIEDDGKKLVEGERNEGLFKLARRYYNIGHSKEEVYTLLKAVNEIKCEPPLPHKEVKTIAKSAENYKSERKIIRNYVNTEHGKKYLLRRNEIMEEPVKYFEVFKTVNDRLLIDKETNETIKKTETFANTLAKYGYDVDFRSGGPYTLTRYFDDIKKMAKEYTRFSLTWEIDLDEKTKIFENIEPENNGYFRKLLDIFTVESEKDRYRIAAAMINAFLGREYDGNKPGFAIIAGWKSSGKTYLAQCIAKIIQGVNAKDMSLSSSSNDSFCINSVEEAAGKYILIDNVTTIYKYRREVDRIIRLVTSRTLPYWEMHITRGQVINNKTFLMTLNDTQDLNADLLERFIIIRMKDGRDISNKKKEEISLKLLEFERNRKKVVADIIYYLQHPSDRDIKIHSHMKFVRWSQFMGRVLAAVFPEIDEFDFWLSEEDIELDSKMVIFEEFIERVLDEHPSGVVTADMMMDAWREEMGENDTYSRSKGKLGKYISRMSKSSRKFEIESKRKRDKNHADGDWRDNINKKVTIYYIKQRKEKEANDEVD